MSSNGIFFQLDSLYYARVVDNNNNTYTHLLPIEIKGTAKISITPNSDANNVNSEKGQMEKAAVLRLIQVEIESAGLTPVLQAALLGHEIDDEGIIRFNKVDTPIEVAIGFRAKKINGSYTYVWLYSGKFKSIVKDYKTSGKDISLQIPHITGFFGMRYDIGEWKAVGDEDNGISQSVIDNWFIDIDNCLGGIELIDSNYSLLYALME